MVTAFVSGFISSIGLSILFNIRRKHMMWAAVGGGMATLTYRLLLDRAGGALIAVFLASLVVGFYSEVMAILQKAPATTYVIPGILPLVPGAGMYYTMLFLTDGELSLAAYHGYQTVFTALAIASGIIIAPSIRRLYHQQKGA